MSNSTAAQNISDTMLGSHIDILMHTFSRVQEDTAIVSGSLKANMLQQHAANNKAAICAVDFL